MAKRDMATIKKLIEKHKDVIAKERDALRELEGELTDICDSCDSAIANLESAVDDLSQYL